MMLGDRCLSPALLQAIPIAASISDLTLAALNPAEKFALKFWWCFKKYAEKKQVGF